MTVYLGDVELKKEKVEMNFYKVEVEMIVHHTTMVTVQAKDIREARQTARATVGGDDFPDWDRREFKSIEVSQGDEVLWALYGTDELPPGKEVFVQ